MLFRGSSVHGIGMKEPLWAVGLDAARRVLAVRRLAPYRAVWIRGVDYIIELPIEDEPPAIGDSFDWSDTGAAAPEGR
jgi:hypothetical protein